MRRPLVYLLLAIGCLGVFASLGLGGSLHTAKSFQVTCSTSATAIAGGDGYQSIWCDNNSTTSVFVGGSDVASSNNICISTNTSNCPRRDLPADYAHGALYCRVASGTQAISCLAGK
jgi:hypothetical protein